MLALLLPPCFEAPPAPEAGPEEPPWVEVVELRLGPVEVQPTVARPDETQGLVLALLERRLGELEGVLPRVEGVEVRPALALAVPAAEVWTLQARVEGQGEAIELWARLCDPTERCQERRSPAERVWPGPATAATVAWVGATLGRRFLGSTQAWPRRESRDDYALLILGRAGATAFGLRPPVDEAERGDPRRDPLARAVFLDPTMATGWYLRARSPLSGPPETRRAHAERSSRQEPDDPLLLADAAALALAAGEAERALLGFEGMMRVAPQDLRFPLALAEAGLLAHEPGITRRALARLREVPAADSSRLSLEVRLNEQTGELSPAELDQRLAEWAVVDALNAEPVQRRVDLKVRQRELEAALALIPELKARAPGAATERQELALNLALRRFSEAAALAQGLGEGEIALDLQAVQALDRPAEAAAVLAAGPRLGQSLARGALLLRAGEAADAATLADGLLAADPWQPDALALAIESARALGLEERALQLALRLGQVDPLHRLALRPPRVGP